MTVAVKNATATARDHLPGANSTSTRAVATCSDGNAFGIPPNRISTGRGGAACIQFAPIAYAGPQPGTIAYSSGPVTSSATYASTSGPPSAALRATRNQQIIIGTINW